GLAVRLALRDARHDAVRLALCALLVGVAVSFGIVAMGTTSGGGGANLRVEATRKAGAGLEAPAVRFWDRAQILRRAGGTERRLDRSAKSTHASREAAAAGSAVAVPRGSTVAAFGAASATLVGDRRVVSVVVVDPSLDRGPAAGETHVERGRAPATAGEI